MGETCYNPRCQDRVAGFSFAFLRRNPSLVKTSPVTVLAIVQERSSTKDLYFMAKGNIGKHPWNWKGGRTVTQDGYVLIFVGKDHPIADVRGYAYEHRLKAYNAGHDIKGKRVHHEDEVKSNNDLANLSPLSPAWHGVAHRTTGQNKQLPGQPNPLIECECGCGGTFLLFDNSKRPRRFVSGHNMFGQGK